MSFRFRLNAADGAAYYCDSVDSTLRVYDNTRAHRAGVKFTRCEYGKVEGGKVRKWYPVEVEELRKHDIEHLYAVDSRAFDRIWIVWYLLAAFCAGILFLGFLLSS